ncbi:MAG: hypothetical protein OEU54_04265 [Gemmatimonadota bacterium]|nr:hypothetical protein [Gemmatimonadota bacterium]
MSRRLWFLGVALALGVSALAEPLFAQSAPGEDPLADAYFAPELVMAHRERVGIDDRQWEQIGEEIRSLQREVVDLEWEMAEAAQTLLELSGRELVPEAEALAAAMRIFDVEAQIKAIQLRMLVRIKNALTGAQQAELRRIRGGA